MSYILNRKVLLLNQSYEPLMIIGAKRAILMMLMQKVEVVEKYTEQIHSTFLTIPLPSVIRLKWYARFKKKEIVLSRRNILRRDNHQCQYCSIRSVPMTIDLVIPRNKGGRDTWENLVAACVKCNTKKGDSNLHDLSMNLLRTPKKPHHIYHMQKYVKRHQDSWRPYLFMEKN